MPKCDFLNALKTSGIGFLVFCVSGILTTHSLAEEKQTNVSVVVAKASQLVDEVPLSGTVTSIRNANISSKEAGYIKSLIVDEGNFVNQGDIILELDRELADLEIARVQSQINEAEARQTELERQRDEAAELMKKNHIASTRYEASKAEVEINKAVIQGLKTELQRQRVIAKRHTVYAPFSGVIAEKFIEIGQWVENNTTLLNLIELDPLRIEVAAPQYYYNQLTVGMPVNIRYDAIKDQTFKGKVTRKIPVSDQTARTFTIFIDIDNGERLIAPGMSARVNFQLLNSNKAYLTLLPRDAIVQKPDGSKSIWKVSTKDGKTIAETLVVKTGKSIKRNIEILSDNISIGDRIIVKGNELLQPEQAVNVTEELDYQLQ